MPRNLASCCCSSSSGSSCSRHGCGSCGARSLAWGPCRCSPAAWLWGQRCGGWACRPMAAGVVGFGLSLSSTPLVLQVLAERNQLKTQYGRAAFSILLFQDLAVLPMLAVLPLMSPQSQPGTSGSPWLALVKLVAVIAVVTVRRAPGAAAGLADRRAHQGDRGIHGGRAPRGHRNGTSRQSRWGCRWRSAPSSPASCSPTANSATSSKRTSSPSRDSCSDSSSSRSECRPTSGS